MTTTIRTARPAPGKPASLLPGGIALASATAHGAAAVSADGPMAWAMAAMGVLCLGCLAHLRPGGHGPRAATVHLMLMCAAMALAHVCWLALQAPAGHHGHPGRGSAGDAGYGPQGHGQVMLALVAFELACMAASSAVLRRLPRCSAATG